MRYSPQLLRTNAATTHPRPIRDQPAFPRRACMSVSTSPMAQTVRSTSSSETSLCSTKRTFASPLITYLRGTGRGDAQSWAQHLGDVATWRGGLACDRARGWVGGRVQCVRVCVCACVRNGWRDAPPSADLDAEAVEELMLELLVLHPRRQLNEEHVGLQTRIGRGGRGREREGEDAQAASFGRTGHGAYPAHSPGAAPYSCTALLSLCRTPLAMPDSSRYAVLLSLCRTPLAMPYSSRHTVLLSLCRIPLAMPSSSRCSYRTPHADLHGLRVRLHPAPRQRVLPARRSSGGDSGGVHKDASRGTRHTVAMGREHGRWHLGEHTQRGGAARGTPRRTKPCASRRQLRWSVSIASR